MGEEVEEIWKPIEGYPDYEISNLAHVRRKPTYMSTHMSTQGYIVVSLAKGHRKHQLVPLHRALATAFIPNPKNLPYVGFKNGDKYDVRLENLAWCNKWQLRKDRIYYDENSIDIPFPPETDEK